MQSVGNKKVARRDVLRAAAGITAAGAIVGVPALVWQGKSGSADGGAAATATTTNSMDLSQPLVAYVQDARKGEVVIMAGVGQVVVTDHDLVARLADAGRV